MVYDTLCLSSGGVYGIAYIGVIDYLIEEKIIDLDNIKKYVGTSVGALFLFMLIIGYSIKDINDIILDKLMSYKNLTINLLNIRSFFISNS
jgi:predicted acylesterase/phospholipase RssA